MSEVFRCAVLKLCALICVLNQSLDSCVLMSVFYFDDAKSSTRLLPTVSISSCVVGSRVTFFSVRFFA